MLEFIQNDVARWAISLCASVLLGLATIFVPNFLGSKKKALLYTVYSYPLMSRSLGDERLALFFDGTEVPEVYVSVIRLIYEGTEPVVENDYRNPPTFDYQDTSILAADVVSVSPQGIQASARLDPEGKVILEPLALNDGNKITIRVISSSPPGDNYPKASSHIVGVPELQVDTRTPVGAMRLLRSLLAFAVVLLLVGVLLQGLVPIFIGGYLLVMFLSLCLLERVSPHEIFTR